MMKKLLIFMMIMGCLFSCHRKKQSIPVVKEINVEEVISMDNKSMLDKYGDNYRWYESCIVLDNFLDEENEGTVNEIVNVFQTVISKDEGFDTQVYKIQHFKDGTVVSDSVKGFWVEDFPLEEIKVPFDSAFNLVMQVNLPKPHSRYCVLRKEIGPNAINPQYIFGNSKVQIYVDAITGKVTDKNPAFPKAFKMPLWP